MPDYRCPSCGGGFPASVGITADACPWCGEAMDGDDDESSSVVTPSATATAAVDPIAPDIGQRIRQSDLLGDRFQDPEDADSPLDTPPLYDHGLGARTPSPLDDRARTNYGNARMQRASDRLDDGGDA